MLEKLNNYFEVDFTKQQLRDFVKRVIISTVVLGSAIGAAIVKNTIL